MMTTTEFKQRVVPLQRRMYGLALRIGLEPDDAADAVQEALAELWHFRERLENMENADGYCLRVVRNKCVDIIRRRHEKIPIEDAGEVSAEVRDSAEERDTRRAMEMLISRLPRGQATAIRLSSFGDLDNTRIAELTGTTEANVRQLLSRGRRSLRDLFRELNL